MENEIENLNFEDSDDDYDPNDPNKPKKKKVILIILILKDVKVLFLLKGLIKREMNHLITYNI